MPVIRLEDVERGVSGALLTCPEHHHTSFSEEYTSTAGGAIAAVTIITPPASKILDIHRIFIHSEATSGNINLDFLTSGIKVARMYPAKSGVLVTGAVHFEGVADEVLTLSATGIGNTKKVFVSIQYIIAPID